MSDINGWSTTAASNNSAPPDGWPENMAYSAVNNSARENMAATKRWFADTNGSLIAAGTANAFTVTLNAPYAAYFTGLMFACKLAATNTSSSSMTGNVNGLGTKNVVDDHTGLIPAIGALQINGIYTFRYDGTSLRVLGRSNYEDLPQNSQSGNYTVVATDRGKHIYHPNGAGAGHTFTVPSSGTLSFAIGTVLTFVNMDSNDLAITFVDNVVMAVTNDAGPYTLLGSSIATALKVQSSQWLISGTGLI